MMMAFVEIDLNGLMQWGASSGREPFVKSFTKMFGTRHIKIDSHEDDIFNRRSQLICAGGAECFASVGRGENDINIGADTVAPSPSLSSQSAG